MQCYHIYDRFFFVFVFICMIMVNEQKSKHAKNTWFEQVMYKWKIHGFKSNFEEVDTMNELKWGKMCFICYSKSMEEMSSCTSIDDYIYISKWIISHSNAIWKIIVDILILFSRTIYTSMKKKQKERWCRLFARDVVHAQIVVIVVFAWFHFLMGNHMTHTTNTTRQMTRYGTEITCKMYVCVCLCA